MARHPKVRMIPPRKLNVSKCLSGGGTTVGDMVVVGCTVVLFGAGTVVGDDVLVVLGGKIVVGTGGEAVVVLGGGTDVGDGGNVVDSFDIGVVAGGAAVVVVVRAWQRATAHSPQRSNPQTSSFILCGT